MIINSEFKSGIVGSIIGAVIISAVGFSWGGWVTNAGAVSRADHEAEERVVAALVPICIEQSMRDPQSAAVMAQLGATNSYKWTDIVVDAGWATMPGAEKPNRPVAAACAKKIGKAL